MGRISVGIAAKRLGADVRILKKSKCYQRFFHTINGIRYVNESDLEEIKEIIEANKARQRTVIE